MCGIAGIIGGSPEVLSDAIARMQEALGHRGPDSGGSWISNENSAALGHTRLAILDLSDAGRQPMQQGPLRIVFNGEIYNFRKLRDALASDSFRSETDTEVILKLYERHGPSCVQALSGMFAFAIHDVSTNQVFLARDPFGIKPLYYTETNGTLLFASELRALLASGLVARKLCPQGLDGYLRTGSVPEPFTMVHGIRMLPAGSTLCWNPTKPADPQKYWDIKFDERPCSSTEAAERAHAALEETVARHFVSDVPVGIFLSGGIDSSAIAFTAISQGRKLQTFSLGVDEAGLDESDLASRVAKQLGTTHHTLRMDRPLAREWQQDFLAAQDQPSVDGFNTYCISRYARSMGAKVVLSGLGGDEIFGGYPSFHTVPDLLRWSAALRSGRNPAWWIGHAMEHFAPTGRLRRIGEWLGRPASVNASYHLIRSLFSKHEAALISRRFGIEDKKIHEEVQIRGCDANAISTLELTHYMRNQLLRDSDVMSMTHGVELRVPIVDREFFLAMASLPAPLRMKRDKNLLVQASPGIPSFISERPKTGFTLPLEHWFNPLPEMSPRFPIPMIPWYREWALRSLQCWLIKHKII